MMITKDQVMSYGTYVGAGGTGYVAQKVGDAEPKASWAAHMITDIAAWSAMDYLTAGCMALGAIGVLHRMYVDWSLHRARKRHERKLAESYQWPSK
ncbi:hypothetical protein GCM10011348_45940 [Marinobacterium nitratireducens]|uniref:Uncharacterized protein n=1 Tax=Marinobacterium nitratireducens TaxID=518897 RepID=A0A917ZRC6_9GAMM|nr:hypothetical protein [Marinobacterium nitratireducens]GGO89064.1 hypothetical protein GCM10011348_45940 [Marinobacterium nitratireducens]